MALKLIWQKNKSKKLSPFYSFTTLFVFIFIYESLLPIYSKRLHFLSFRTFKNDFELFRRGIGVAFRELNILVLFMYFFFK